MNLFKTWNEKLESVTDNYALYLRVDGDVAISHNVDMAFSSASMVKTFIAYVVARAETRGQVGWEQQLTISDKHLAPGDGVLQHFHLPAYITLYDAMTLMLATSDNMATNAIIDHMGGTDAVNSELADLGFKRSRLRGWVGGRGHATNRDELVPAQGLPTQTGIGVVTAAEHARAIDELYQYYPPVFEMLGWQKDRRSLARFVPHELPGGTVFAHKTGTADGLRHDGGLYLSEEHSIAVHCLTDGPARPGFVDDAACFAMGAAMRELLIELSEQ